MKRTALVFIAFLLCPFFVVQGSQVEDMTSISVSAEPPLMGEGCKSVLLMEASTGLVLYEHAADEKAPIASVTKIMTLLLIVEAIDDGRIALEDMVTVSENAASKGGSQIYLEVGESMSVHELLKAVFVASANDGAVALAEHLCGSEAAFISEMNQRALELGMDTAFVNPTGLDDKEYHESSARDVALMSRELLSHEWITDYTTIWMDSVRNGAFGLTNTNRLVRFYSGSTGLKTGSTSKAKFCLSASAKRESLHLIAVVLGAETSDRRFAAAKELLDYGFANYALYTRGEASFSPIRVWGGEVGSVDPYFETKGILVRKADFPKISEEVILEKELIAPVSRGQAVGRVVYRMEGQEIASHSILAGQEVKKKPKAEIFRSLLSESVFGLA